MARTKSTTQKDGNVSRATFLEFFDELTSTLRLKASADSAVASVYKKAENAGLDRKQLKRAYAESQKATDEREVDDRRFRLYMEWLGKPVGTQATLELPPEPATGGGSANGAEIDPEAEAAETAAVEKHENNQAFNDGVYAGKSGADMTRSNPFQEGTEEYQSFSSGWASGQKEAVDALGGTTRRRRAAAGTDA